MFVCCCSRIPVWGSSIFGYLLGGVLVRRGKLRDASESRWVFKPRAASEVAYLSHHAVIVILIIVFDGVV